MGTNRVMVKLEGEGRIPAEGELDTLPASDGASADATEKLDDGSTKSYSRPRAAGAPAAGSYRRYEIVGEHARGGLGRVLRARDTKLQRDVALKELLGGGFPAEERFLREAQITARLEHPAIVPVHELSHRPDGRPFYTMKMIAGRSLKTAIDEAKSLEERLGLIVNLQSVADAIAYAHSRRIIHRDLKPANIICGEFGETIVIDWGIAKDLDDPSHASGPDDGPYREAASVGLTQTGTVLGTPAYMPPEQARGDQVDQRADVYALGAMLYHIVVGAVPYAKTRGDSVVAAVLAGPPRPLSALEPAVPADLVAIADKAMARDPADRYASAEDLATDLRRYLTGGLVGARSYSARELVARWIRRHRGIATVAGVALAAVVAIGGFSVMRVLDERDTARRARDAAEQRERELILSHARSALERDPTATVAWLKTYPEHTADQREVEELAADAVGRGVARHVMRSQDTFITALAVAPDGKTAASYGRDDRLWFWDLQNGTGRPVINDVTWDGEKLAMAPDGTQVAMGASDGRILLVGRDGRVARELSGHTVTPYYIEYSSDGNTLVSAGLDKTLRLWNRSDGSSRIVRTFDAPMAMASLASDGARVAVCDFDQNLWVTELSSGSSQRLGKCERWDANGFPLAYLSGDSIAAGNGAGDVQVWSASSGEPRVLRGPPGRVHDLAVSPDERLLAASHSSDTAVVWDLASGEQLWQMEGCGRRVAFSPDGRFLACGGTDGELLLRDLQRGGQWRLRGHEGFIKDMAFSRAGDVLVSAGALGEIRVWRTPSTSPRSAGPFDDVLYGLEYSRDGRWIVSGDRSGRLRITDTNTSESKLVHEYEAPVVKVSALPGERDAFAVVDYGGGIHVWDLTSGENRTLGDHGTGSHVLAVAPDGSFVVSAGTDGQVRMWDVAAGGGRSLGAHDGDINEVAVSPDGTTVASAGSDGDVRLWAVDGTKARRLGGHAGDAFGVRFSPGGDRLATVGKDGSVRIWDIESGAWTVVAQHDAAALQVAWTLDGTRVVSADADGNVLLTDAAGKTEPERLLHHRRRVNTIALSRDGRTVATASGDGTVRVSWLDGGAPLVLYGPGLGLGAVAIAPDGSRVASGGADRVISEWNIERGRVVDLSAETTSVMSRSGEHGTPP